jgi:hypothetical protein
MSGRRREHFLRKSLPERVWADPCRMLQLVVGRFRPSQWRKGVSTVPWWVASAPASLRRLRPMDGRLNLASSQVVPVPFSAPLGTVDRYTRKVSSGPSPGPRVSPATRLLLPGRVRGAAGLGHNGVAASVRGVLGQLAAGGRSRATECCSTARGRRPLRLGVTV